MKLSKSLRANFARIRLLLCDVDGVLTDGGVWMGQGIELKKFHVRDGLGMRILIREGIKVGWISNRPSPATAERAKELKIDYLYQSKGSKVEAANTMMAAVKVGWAEVCYMGDDIVDLELLKLAGVGVAVANAVEIVKASADCVTASCGGEGAVREVVEAILIAQDKWTKVVADHAGGQPK